MSATISPVAAGVTLAMVFSGGVGYAPAQTPSPSEESSFVRGFNFSGRATAGLTVNSGIFSSVNFQAVAVSSTTAESVEETMRTIRTSDTPWSRRLLKLHAVDLVSNSNLAALVGMLQTSDAERWPTPGIFPGEDGGIRFEWHEGRSHASFEVDDEGSMYAYFFDFAHDSESALEPKNVDEAVGFLREHLV